MWQKTGDFIAADIPLAQDVQIVQPIQHIKALTRRLRLLNAPHPPNAHGA
jgi:hypothetical protein